MLDIHKMPFLATVIVAVTFGKPPKLGRFQDFVGLAARLKSRPATIL
jgi:hypothetical protein